MCPGVPIVTKPQLGSIVAPRENPRIVVLSPHYLEPVPTTAAAPPTGGR
jgi:hypothetical protein